MKKSRNLILFGLALILTVHLFYYAMDFALYSENNQITSQTTGLNQLTDQTVTNITLIINYNDGENINFYNMNLIGDITPFNATIVAIGLENIEYYTAINGVFISGLRINGTWYSNNPSGDNWLYYINGQLVGVSCSKIDLSDDWVVEWVFKSGNPFAEDPGLNEDFWLYLCIFIGIGAVCAIGISVLVKKGI